MATVDTARLRELHAAATAGEWEAEELGIYGTETGALIADTYETQTGYADAAYIAAVHNALPAVLDALEQARAERDAYARNLADAQSDIAAEVERSTALVAELAQVRARAQRLEDGLIQHLQQELGIAPQEANHA